MAKRVDFYCCECGNMQLVDSALELQDCPKCGSDTLTDDPREIFSGASLDQR